MNYKDYIKLVDISNRKSDTLFLNSILDYVYNYLTEEMDITNLALRITYVDHSNLILGEKEIYGSQEFLQWLSEFEKKVVAKIKNEEIISITDFLKRSNQFTSAIILNKVSSNYFLENFNDSNSILFLNYHKLPNDQVKSDSLRDTYDFYSKAGDYNHYFFKPIFSHDYFHNLLILITDKEISEQAFTKLTFFLHVILSEYLKNIVKKEGLKSATAAIMARNMSHNLGSHVLSYVKDDLKSQENMLKSKVFPGKYKEFDGRVLKEEFEIENDQQALIKDGFENSKSEGNYLLGLGRLVNYIQERQDFIATIAGDSPPAYATVNFKDFIFDEINYDVKAKRHSENDMKAHTNLLLEYIARSEQVNRMKISILFNGNDIIEEDDKELAFLRKIKFALPGGILGRQAFFAILENIIRNSAKHGGKSKDKGELRLNIRVDEDESYKDYWRVTVFDNNQTRDILGENFEEKHKARIDGDIIDKSDGTLIQADKGLKEMKICAGWLRKIDSTEFENFDFENKGKIPNILDAVIEKDIINKDDESKEKVECLGYRFYIFKPKNVVLIVKDKSEIQLPQNFVDVGWGLYNVDEIEKNLSRIQMFDLLIYTEDCREIIKQKQNLLPQRQIEISTEEINNINENTNLNKQFVKFYYDWLKNEFPEEIARINTVYIEDKNDVDRFKIYNNKKNELLKSIQVRALQDPSNTVLGEADINPQICFVKHYETKDEFTKISNRLRSGVWKDKGKPNYIEGISGGNSTDRIIRREEINDIWLLKVLESAFTKILIIDERIWEKLADPNPPKQKAIGILKNCLKNANNKLTKDEEEIIRKVLAHKYSERSILNFLQKGINDKSRLRDRLEEIQEVKIVDYIVQNVYETKNIYIYNLHRLENDIPVFQDLSKNPDKLIWNNYDFVLLHQGIIDQIYELRNDKKDKTRINEDEFFAAINPKQKLIVHSGRSKPELLPENAIYIPFASIENSFFDCKQTLTELLFSSN